MFDKKICDCICHKEGMTVLHVSPCCTLSGIKYIDAQGTVDEKKVKSLENQRKKDLLEEILINKGIADLGWIKENTPDTYNSIVQSLIEAYNFGIDRANLSARIIIDPNSYCGNTGSEYPPDEIIDRKALLAQKIKE